MIIIPPYLKPGDLVAMIATARKVSEEELRPAFDMLRAWGFEVEAAPHLFNSHHQYAGTDEARAQDLQWALDHPKAKAVIIARGGYGTIRIIDEISLEKFRMNPKWIVGYSDVTVLHNQLSNAGYASLHATMLFSFNKSEKATLSLKKLLSGEPEKYELTAHPLNRAGSATGVVTGGNLSILYAMSGSASETSTQGKILFIEDIDEYLYHIDRMMMNLKRARKLEDLAGLVVGGMTDMRDNAIPFGMTVEEIIAEAVEEYSYPVCFNFPAGHITDNIALYMGAKATLNVGGNSAELIYKV